MSTAVVPHLAFPFRVANGAALTVEQDSLEDVAQCVAVLVTTVQGERIELPDYGVADAAFTVDAPTAQYRHAIERWEPRAVASMDPTWLNGLELLVSIGVATVASGSVNA